jgi:uncharacterized protein (DUF2235 family)
MPPKRIVVCIDGTNNEPRLGRTNVSRFFRTLVKTSDQIAYYQPGVGTLDPDSPRARLVKWSRRVRDLSTAWMMRRHVTSAYRYLMSVYEPGDQIYLIGFSRGAYICRVVAGMLSKVGLLHRGHEEMIGFAWELYRPHKNFPQATAFKGFYSQDVTIRFLGLWDTVRSVGVPWNPVRFANTVSNKHVEIVRHAVALDECRVLYPPNLWSSDPPKGQDVVEVWFPGVHSDIGGGYATVGMGAITLAWMIREAERAGLVFDLDERKRALWRKGIAPPQVIDVEKVTNEFIGEPIHDESLQHWGWRIAEYLPILRFVPSEKGRFRLKVWPHLRGARMVPDHTFVHESVHLRQSRVGGYKPRNCPSDLLRFRW